MHGQRWEQAQATIADVQIVPESRHHARLFRYLVDVRLPSGGTFRGTVEEQAAARRPVGSAVGVEISTKTGELRLDPSQPSSRRADSGLGRPDPLAEMHTSAGSMHRNLETLAEGQGEEIQGLVRAMMARDPAARQAAADRIAQIKAHAQQRAEQQQAAGVPGPTGDSAGADPFAAFDHPGGFSDPAGVGRAAGYPSVPDFGPASGSFGAGASQGTAEERIARLRQLLDKGILTESEFRDQRQRIIDGL